MRINERAKFWVEAKGRIFPKFNVEPFGMGGKEWAALQRVQPNSKVRGKKDCGLHR